MSVPSLASSEIRPGRVLVGWLAALATVTIWALWIVGTRHAVTHDLTPTAVGLLRYGVPALAFAPVWWRVGPFPRGVKPIAALGLLGSGAPFLLVVATAMRFAPAADIGPLLPGTMPFFVALIGWTLFDEKLGRLRLVGFALILLGILAIGGRGLLHMETGAWRGHALLLVGAFMWGIYTHAYRRSGLTPMQAAGLIGFWSVAMLLPFGAPAIMEAIAAGQRDSLIIQTLIQGVASGIVAMVLNGIAIDRLGASRAAAVAPLGPVLAVLLAIPILGEMPDAAALFGLVAATAGVALASGIVRAKGA